MSAEIGQSLLGEKSLLSDERIDALWTIDCCKPMMFRVFARSIEEEVRSTFIAALLERIPSMHADRVRLDALTEYIEKMELGAELVIYNSHDGKPCCARRGLDALLARATGEQP